jgi:hypothetical protein
MSTVFVEFSKPYMMPGGGMAGTGEIASLDPVTAATLIANGIAVSSGAPPAYVAPSMTRIQFTGKAGAIMVGGSPPIFNAGEIATFPAAISAALVAQGLAVLN